MSHPSSDYVQTLFNDVSAKYDDLNDLLSLGFHRIWKRQLITWLSPVSGEKWLDLCCGTGDISLSLSRKVSPGGQVLGVDSASRTLAIARMRSKKTQKLSIVWKRADALNTGLPSHYFDGGVMAYGLRNLADPKAGLRELHRVLKPGGRAGILDFNQLGDGSIREKFQKFYLRKIVVPIASKAGLREHYAYLEKSLNQFPKGYIQEQFALEVGFNSARHRLLAFGQMGILFLQS